MTEAHPDPPSQRFVAPPPQANLRAAVERALLVLGRQTPDQIAWLGAARHGDAWRLSVLDTVFAIDPASGRVATSAGSVVQPAWQILALHYLGVSARPEPRPPEITFADLPSGRGYAGVYEKRVLRRLCATVGRDISTLRQAAAALEARETAGGDAAFRLDVFPRLAIQWIWHAPDEEFPPSATLLLPGNVQEFFCTEDIVVLCESCVSRLCASTLLTDPSDRLQSDRADLVFRDLGHRIQGGELGPNGASGAELWRRPFL